MHSLIKMGIFTLSGAIFGKYLLPLAERIIAYKLRKKTQEVYVYPWNATEKRICMLAAVLLSMSAGYYFSTVQSVLICVFFFVAIIVALIDHRIRIIPNELVLLVFLVGFFFNLTEGGARHLLFSVLSCLATFCLFLLTAWITYFFVKSIGVGAGDIKLASAIAFAVGFNRLSWFYAGIGFALLVYIVIGFYLKRIKIGSTFPMGGQIMAGGIMAYLIPVLISNI